MTAQSPKEIRVLVLAAHCVDQFQVVFVGDGPLHQAYVHILGITPSGRSRRGCRPHPPGRPGQLKTHPGPERTCGRPEHPANQTVANFILSIDVSPVRLTEIQFLRHRRPFRRWFGALVEDGSGGAGIHTFAAGSTGIYFTPGLIQTRDDVTSRTAIPYIPYVGTPSTSSQTRTQRVQRMQRFVVNAQT